MGMFRRKTALPVAADLFTETERERIEFDVTYGAILAGFWRSVAATS